MCASASTQGSPSRTRIASQAKGGEILVSSLVRDLTESSGKFTFDEGEEVELKGLEGAHQLFGVTWEEGAVLRPRKPRLPAR